MAHGTLVKQHASWRKHKYVEVFSVYTTKLDLPQITYLRERPALWDICTGSVLWLPPKGKIKLAALRQCPKLLKFNKKAFDHPVMVLDININGPEDATVTFARLTSKSSLPQGKEKAEALRRGSYLKIFRRPIDNKPASDSQPGASTFLEQKTDTESGTSDKMTQNLLTSFTNDKLLYLDQKESKNRCMTEDSYVDVSAVYSLEWQYLQCYAVDQRPDGYRHRLREESFMRLADRLKGKLQGPVAPWVKTNLLWETFYESHVKHLDSGPKKSLETLRPVAPEFVPTRESTERG